MAGAFDKASKAANPPAIQPVTKQKTSPLRASKLCWVLNLADDATQNMPSVAKQPGPGVVLGDRKRQAVCKSLQSCSQGVIAFNSLKVSGR